MYKTNYQVVGKSMTRNVSLLLCFSWFVSVQVFAQPVTIRLIGAITRDVSGNGMLDQIELNFSRKFELPANASFACLTIVANQTDTLAISKILNTGSGIDDSVWIVQLTESHTDLPQTGWTPIVNLPLQSAYNLAAIIVTAIDGAGPVVWKVVTYPVVANDHGSDSVVVTFSEPVQRYDGGSLNPSDRPMDIFYVWQKDPSDTTKYLLVPTMFAGINNLKRDPGRSNTLTFTMSNGNDFNRGYYLSIGDSTREYVTDTTVYAIQPNLNNKLVRVSDISTAQPDISSASKHCGCGAGTGLAFFPPIVFKLGSWRRKKRKKAITV